MQHFQNASIGGGGKAIRPSETGYQSDSGMSGFQIWRETGDRGNLNVSVIGTPISAIYLLSTLRFSSPEKILSKNHIAILHPSEWASVLARYIQLLAFAKWPFSFMRGFCDSRILR